MRDARREGNKKYLVYFDREDSAVHDCGGRWIARLRGARSRRRGSTTTAFNNGWFFMKQGWFLIYLSDVDPILCIFNFSV
jgi:hypothetical protein